MRKRIATNTNDTVCRRVMAGHSRSPVKIGDTVTVIVTVAELMPEKITGAFDGEALVKVPQEEKGKWPLMRL